MTMRDRNRGFTLLEVLVAFSILAIVLAVIFQLVGSSLRNVAVADGYGQAAVVAESVLARMGTEYPAEGGGPGSGTDGGYRWQTQAQAYPGGSAELPLYEVAVTVTWGIDERRALTLSSLRLGSKPQ